MEEYQCKICSNSCNNLNYLVKERMFGYGDQFSYVECGQCGCVQIKEIPKNISKYYPSHYYSFEPQEEKLSRLSLEGLKRGLKKKVLDYRLGKKTVIGCLIAKRYKNLGSRLVKWSFS